MKSWIRCFIKKITLFMTLLQFRTILLPNKLCVTEKRTYVNKGCNLEILYLLTGLFSIPCNKLPWHFPLVLFVARTCQIGREVSNMVQSQNWPPKDPKVIWCLCYGSKHYIDLPLNKESAVIFCFICFLNPCLWRVSTLKKYLKFWSNDEKLDTSLENKVL